MSLEKIKVLGDTAISVPEVLATAMEGGSTLDARLKEHEGKLDSATSSMTARLEELFGELRESLEQSQAAREDLETELAEVEAVVKTLSESATDERQSLMAETEELRSRIDAFGDMATNSVAQVNAANQEAQEAMQRVLEAMISGRDNLENALDSVVASLTKLRETTDACRISTEETVSHAVEEINEMCTSLVTKVEELQTLLDGCVSEFDDRIDQVQTEIVKPVFDELKTETFDRVDKQLLKCVNQAAEGLRNRVDEIRESLEGCENFTQSEREELEPQVAEISNLLDSFDSLLQNVRDVRNDIGSGSSIFGRFF